MVDFEVSGGIHQLRASCPPFIISQCSIHPAFWGWAFESGFESNNREYGRVDRLVRQFSLGIAYRHHLGTGPSDRDQNHYQEVSSLDVLPTHGVGAPVESVWNRSRTEKAPRQTGNDDPGSQ